MYTLWQTRKKITMKIVTSREFRENQKMYFDLVDHKEQVIIRRARRAYRLIPVDEKDLLVSIPDEYRTNPFDKSPSGDIFWADMRNVEKIKESILATLKNDKNRTVLRNESDISNFINNISCTPLKSKKKPKKT